MPPGARGRHPSDGAGAASISHRPPAPPPPRQPALTPEMQRETHLTVRDGVTGLSMRRFRQARLLALSREPAPEPHRPAIIAPAPQRRALQVRGPPRGARDSVPAALPLASALDFGDTQRLLHGRHASARHPAPWHTLPTFPS